MYRLLTRIGAALACALTTLALAACGGTGGPAAATTPSLPTEDVVGIWQASGETPDSGDWSAMNDKGIYVFYHFEQDGTFSIEGVIPGSGLVRTGTWKVDGEKVLINLPEQDSSAGAADGGDAESNAEAIADGKSQAIEDGEVTIDGDTLTTDAIGDGATITATRISEDDYNAALEKSKALGPQDVAVGQTVDTDAFSFTVSSISYQQEIYPSDTSGYYNYYTDQAGTTYLVASVTFTNKGTDAAVPGWSTSATLTVNGNNYQATPEVDGGNRTSQSYRVEAQQTSQMIIWAAVPDNVVNTGEVTLSWSLPKAASGLGQYYSANADNVTYRIK